MPRINGFEFCEQIMADNETNNIPTIFVSSLTNPEHVERGLSIGAVDFISKPISKIETLARIKNHLRTSQLKHDLANTNEKLNKLLESKSYILDEEIIQKERINARLSESEKRFELLFEAAPTAMVMVSVDSGEIIDANIACSNLTGYSHEELIGINQNDLLQPSEEKISENYFQTKESISNLLNVRMALNTLIKKDGTKIPVQNSSKTILSENELYIFSTIFDLSARINMENELESSKNKAEELNRLKGFFLSNISHELRTPLVGILGFSQLLEEELVDVSLKNMAKAITTSGNRLLNTLQVLLQYSMLETNKQIISWNRINLNSTICEVVANSRNDFEAKNLIINTILPQKYVYIEADQSFISEVFSQLFNNAIAYTNTGSITLTLETKNISDKFYALFSIEDTGIGISEEKLYSIFDDFRQGSEGYTRDYDGLGLGLALVKKIVGLHSGEITVRSKLNEGSLFILTLELKKENQISDKFIEN